MPQTFDITFWMGIGIGAVFSLLASIVANIYSDAIREYLGRRKQIRLSNRKSRELRTYVFLKELKAGDPTATMRFIYSQSAANYTTVAAILLISMGMFLVLLSNSNFAKAQELDPDFLHLIKILNIIMLSVSGIMFFTGYIRDSPAPTARRMSALLPPR